MFEGPVMATVEMDEDGHDLTQAQRGLALAVALAGLEQMTRINWDKRLTEIVDIAEYSDELQLAHRNPLVV
jgi:hypothetical protein